MPYSVGSNNLPSNVKKLPAKKKKKWVAVFNETYNSCINDGGSNESCETKAFEMANGNIRKMTVQNRDILHRVWEGFLISIGLEEPVKRAMNFERVWQGLSAKIRENSEEEWAYINNIYVENNKDLFVIVGRGGKLFRVPFEVSGEEIVLGDWVQVEEEFSPVQQNRFYIRRQKDGKHRWVAIAGTAVLNRVGEIDSRKLFDCFVRVANEENKWPRLDFYHLGETNPAMWEFGTADYLARDGVCYIASGTFDEDHPLARATIAACEADTEGIWGNSIEFYAYAEPEKLQTNPEIEIPVYNEGENTRISVVLEDDAAGLFTRMGTKNEVKRTMDKATRNGIEKLFGDNTEGLQAFLDQFEEGVDETNKRVKNEKLIHRTAKNEDADDGDDQGDDDGEDGVDEDVEDDLVLDESAVEAITQSMLESEPIQKIVQAVEAVQQSLVANQKKIEQLEKVNSQLLKVIERLNKDDEERQSEYLQDLPAKKGRKVSFRARDAYRHMDGDADDYEEETYEDVASRTIANLPIAY